MLRAFLCGVMVFAVAAGCHRADNKAAPKGGGRSAGARGTLKSVDPAVGTLTVNVRSRQDPNGAEKTFQVEDDTTITSFVGEAKTELKGRDGLRDPQFKPGARVAVTTSEDGGKVVSVQVGDMPRRGGRNRGNRGPLQ
ncbi:MAG TPA: hypothetical protein VH575_14615 [Gemmataceae bacterium]